MKYYILKIFSAALLLAALIFSTAAAKGTNTLTFGGETFRFPKNTSLQLLESREARLNALSPVSPDAEDYTQFNIIMGNLFDSSDSTLYQIVTPSTNGIQTAFIGTFKVAKNRFEPSLWGALFPGFPPDTFINLYSSKLQQELAAKSPYPVFRNESAKERIDLHSLSPQISLVNTHNELVQTQDAVFTLHFNQMTLPLSCRYYSWQYKEDFYIVFFLSLAGERSYWESFPKPYQTNFKPLVN